MPFTARPLADLPKRPGNDNPRTFDQEAADAILALVSEPGQTATDGTSYADRKAARAAQNSARRLLARVLPDGKEIKGRAYPEPGTDPETFAWALWIVDAVKPTAPETNGTAPETAAKPAKS